MSGVHAVNCSRDAKVVRERNVCAGNGLRERDYSLSTAQFVIIVVFGRRSEENIVKSFAKVFSGVVVEFLIHIFGRIKNVG